jgi:2-polyprenyl-3-methyl-5-hydroxy-6-metoxy-1,4-benzoquinol methylase
MPTQERFETVYRGRQSWLHHAAYMRMCKVLLTCRILRLAGVHLENKSIFDYGFGAGTFFRYCPLSSHLLGVEQDPVVVNEVAEMLRTRGNREIDLQTIGLENWREHPLWQRSYDVFLCSHVLEHLQDPVEFLRLVRPTLSRTGIFIGLVPINERASNPHHLQLVNKTAIEDWVVAAGYEMVKYEENDPFLYWLQPFFTATKGWKHKLAQLISLDVGISACVFGERAWFAWGKTWTKLTFSKPTQAAFILRPKP